MVLFLTNMQLFTSQDANLWTGVVWITCIFLWSFELSFWRHPFTADDPSVSNWCNDKFLQICFEKRIHNLAGLRERIFSANFHFWVNYSFKLWSTHINNESRTKSNSCTKNLIVIFCFSPHPDLYDIINVTCKVCKQNARNEISKNSSLVDVYIDIVMII